MMARGRRRVAATAAKNGENPPHPLTPVHARLDHPYASPESKITNYFTPGQKKAPDDGLRLSPRKHASTTCILQQANNIEKKSPHRIEMTAARPAPKPKPRRKVVGESIDSKVSKLTDYFPVRRSVRKTKKTVLEEKQRHIENAILSEREDGLEVHCFPDKGRGVVATRPFKRGDFVVEYAGELISLDEARVREQKYAQDQNTGCYMYYFQYRNVQYCIDATPESKRLGRLVNHSRNGNLLTKSISVGGVPRLVLIAKDDINVGDELMYDYGDRSKESLYYHPWLAL